MTKRSLCLTLLGITLGLVLQWSATAAEFDQSHAPFDGLLKHYVKDARVDYAALKAHPADLDRYLTLVAAVPESNFKQWAPKQQIAFLLNAYNAYTIQLIINHYPIKSIKDIGNWTKGPWDQPVVHLFGRALTLNDLEHKTLRVNYQEPRIHFALVCAAKGCPPLRSEPYVASRLDEQLNDQARQFLANPNKNRAGVADHTVYLSPIFKWYGADFEKQSGSVLAFLKPHWPEKERAELGNGHFTIRYTDYDWSLNDTPRK